MTTLTPHRKALTAALDTAKAALPAYDPADMESATRHMTLDLQRAMLLVVADMYDHRVAGSDVTHVIANSTSNALLSHAMSCAGGDQRTAATMAADLLAQTSALLAMSFGLPSLADFVVGESAIEPMGTA